MKAVSDAAVCRAVPVLRVPQTLLSVTTSLSFKDAGVFEFSVLADSLPQAQLGIFPSCLPIPVRDGRAACRAEIAGSQGGRCPLRPACRSACLHQRVWEHLMQPWGQLACRHSVSFRRIQAGEGQGAERGFRCMARAVMCARCVLRVLRAPPPQGQELLARIELLSSTISNALRQLPNISSQLDQLTEQARDFYDMVPDAAAQRGLSMMEVRAHDFGGCSGRRNHGCCAPAAAVALVRGLHDGAVRSHPIAARASKPSGRRCVQRRPQAVKAGKAVGMNLKVLFNSQQLFQAFALNVKRVADDLARAQHEVDRVMMLQAQDAGEQTVAGCWRRKHAWLAPCRQRQGDAGDRPHELAGSAAVGAAPAAQW